MRRRLVVGAALVAAVSQSVAYGFTQEALSALASYDLQKTAAEQVKLPKKLKEISGLATTADDRVFAVQDEKGVVYQVDARTGEITKSFVLGDGKVKDDFEGIAIADSEVFLVTSNGRLYRTREGRRGEAVPYRVYETGVGKRCEVEGLAFEPVDRSLLILCKNPRIKELEDVVAIYRWSVDDEELVSGGTILVPEVEFTRRIGKKRFEPSGIERHPTTGTYLLVAAKQEWIAEVNAAGEVLDAIELPRKLHRQVEGITILSDLSLLISDEGNGRRARLTMYPPSANEPEPL